MILLSSVAAPVLWFAAHVGGGRRARLGRAVGGSAGARAHRALLAPSHRAAGGFGSGVPARRPLAVSRAQERQLLPGGRSADRAARSAGGAATGAGDPAAALEARSRVPRARHAGVHAWLAAGHLQLSSTRGAGAQPVRACEQRAGARRRRRLRRDARRSHPALLHQRERGARAGVGDQGDLR